MKKLEGKLFVFSDQGIGPCLSFENCNAKGYNAIQVLEEGDYLKVFDKTDLQLKLYEEKGIVWQGEITSELAKICFDYYYIKKNDAWSKMFTSEMKAELYKGGLDNGNS